MKLQVLDKERLCNLHIGCIIIFLRSIVAASQSNENGRFSTQLGHAKLNPEVKSKMLFFSERQNYFEEKNRLFVFLLEASYMQKGSEIEFSSLAEEI